MSYTIHDWFTDRAVPKLKSAVDEIEKNVDDITSLTDYEIFIREFKRILDDGHYVTDNFKGQLLKLIVDKEETHSQIEEFFKLINNYNDDKSLMFMVYKVNGVKITCEFNIGEDE